jgi:uncharacterized NAD(P)/FAD-binding protein YdhS
VHGRLEAEFAEGRAELLRGSVTSVERDGDAFRLTLRPRGSPRLEALTVDLAFDCTGHRPDLNSPLIQSLVAQGAARADVHRLGLAVEPNGQVLRKAGTPTRGLFALGPLCQGSLWEITAVPEIVRQCDQAALSLATFEPSAEREVELFSYLAKPRISARKTEWLTPPALKKPRNLGIFHASAGGIARRR